MILRKYYTYLIIFFCWCFLIFGSALQVHAEQVTQAEYDLFTEAKKMLDAGNFNATNQALAKYFSQKGKKHRYGYELYGASLLATKQYKTAIRILEAGTAQNPKSASMLQNLGMAYYHAGQKVQAAKIFQRAYALVGNKNPSLAYMAAHFFVDAKQYSLAVKLLQPLIALKSAKPVWYQVLAQAYVGLGDDNNAALTMEKGLARFGNSAEMWRLLGYMYYKQKKMDKAAAAYEVAYKLVPPTAQDL